MDETRSFLLSIIGTALLAGAAHAQKVWTVDDNGPADFSDVQGAVSAAADGDVVLVRTGLYTSFVIDGKSLLVHGDVGGGVALTDAGARIDVRNLASSQSVVIRGVDAVGQGASFSSFPAVGMYLGQNQGPVWIEDCSIRGTNGGFIPIGHGGASIENCASVVFARCTIQGSPTDEVSQGQNHGLQIVSSNVSLYDCEVAAGASAPAPPSPGWCPSLFCGDLSISCHSTEGGHGVTMFGGSTLFASGCRIDGADAGPGQNQPNPSLSCTPGGNGGDGIRVFSGTVKLRDTIVLAGRGTPGGNWTSCPGQCPSGSNGAPITNPSVVTSLAGAARSFSIGSPNRENSTANVTFDGIANDVCVLAVSASPASAFFAGEFAGTFVIGAPFLLFTFVTLPATGTTTVGVPVGLLPPAAQGLGVFAQAFFAESSSSAVLLAGPSAFLLLDQAF